MAFSNCILNGKAIINVFLALRCVLQILHIFFIGEVTYKVLPDHLQWGKNDLIRKNGVFDPPTHTHTQSFKEITSKSNANFKWFVRNHVEKVQHFIVFSWTSTTDFINIWFIKLFLEKGVTWLRTSQWNERPGDGVVSLVFSKQSSV